MEDIFKNAPPFSDYVILYFVNRFGLDWLEFYHAILVTIGAFAIGGWVIAFYATTKCQRSIQEAIEETENNNKRRKR